MKKFKRLVWDNDAGNCHNTVMLLDGNFEFVICFSDGNLWNLNTGNKDPSELIHAENSLQQLKDWVQKEHESSILSEFFEE